VVKEDIKENIKNSYKRFVRIKTLMLVFAFVTLVLTGRLFYLQAVKGAHYGRLAQSNCISMIKDRAPRGNIYDRNYRVLAANEPANIVSIIPYHFHQNEDREKAVNEVAKVLGIEPDTVMEKLAEKREYMLEPVQLKRGISVKELSLITELSANITGISVSVEPARVYENGRLASHTIGYVSEISAARLKERRYEKYLPGDIIGQAGVENYYDSILRGEDGVMYILTDAKGRQLDVVRKIESKKGTNVVLTIDARLQAFAENLMERNNYKGVILVSDPKTGEMLAAVSKPDYDLTYFSRRIDLNNWKRLIRNKDNPLNNRYAQGLYSPGSIFKIPVGIGALTEKVVVPTTTFHCEGIYWIRTWPYKCWKRSGHNWMDFYRAVAQSCDIYFYRVGLKMTVEALHKYAVMFGLGERTGIDIPGERQGIVPSREWKRRIDRSPWFPGNTVMMSIGQGYITSTPLQMMNIISAMANYGYAMQPHFFKAATTDGRRIIKRHEHKKLFELKAPKENIEMMRKAMQLVVHAGYGTGGRARVEKLSMGGKTGTVENPHGETHAMFGAFAPYINPELVVFVLVEHGGGGGDVAAPIAGEIFRYWFKVLKEK